MGRDDLNITINVSPGGQAMFAEDHGTVQAICPPPKPIKCLTRQPVKNCDFVGRTWERAETKRQLCQYNKLLLYGIGGVGKTALAKAIYFDVQKQYAHVAWVDFENNLKDSLLRCISFFEYKLPVTASEEEKYNKLIQFFTNVEKNAFLVIDNFRTEITEDISELMRLPCDILITSRGKIDGISSFHLERPKEDECKKLFLTYYPYRKELSIGDDNTLSELLVQDLKRHTLSIELAAKAIGRSGDSIDEFRRKFKRTSFPNKQLGVSVTSDWNNPYFQEDITIQIGKIYQLSELTPPEEEITKLLSVLPPFARIAKKDLQNWLSFEDTYALASLESRGWIRQESTSVFMHEVVCDCVYRYHEITFADCHRMLNNLETKMNYEHDGDLLSRIRYAEYTLYIIRLKKGEDSAFCQHLAVKDAALVFKEIGKYEISKELLDIIIPYCGEDKQGGNLLLAELCNNYSKVCSMQSDMENAILWALRAETSIDKIKDDTSGNYYFQKMIIKKTVGTHYTNLGKYDLARERMDEAVQLAPYVPEEMQLQVANMYSDLSFLMYSMGDFSRSAQNYEHVLRLYNKCGLPKENTWRYTTYTNYADVLLHNRCYGESIQYAFLALEGKYKIYETDNFAIANVLMIMGNIFRQEKRMWDIATLFYEKAEKIFKINQGCDGHCDALACQSIVTQNIKLGQRAFNLMKKGRRKKNYCADTYIDLILALQDQFPEKAIFVGNWSLDSFKKSAVGHPAEQYIIALLGQLYYKVGDHGQAKQYLQRIEMDKINGSSWYCKSTKDILSTVPLL